MLLIDSQNIQLHPEYKMQDLAKLLALCMTHSLLMYLHAVRIRQPHSYFTA